MYLSFILCTLFGKLLLINILVLILGSTYYSLCLHVLMKNLEMFLSGLSLIFGITSQIRRSISFNYNIMRNHSLNSHQIH